MCHILQMILATSMFITLKGDHLTDLSSKEELVNRILMQMKKAELESALEQKSKFLPSQHFFEVKTDIENSKVFQFIKTFPKGANLNLHLGSMLPVDMLLELIHQDIYLCISGNQYTLSFINYTYGECKVFDKACNLGRDYQEVYKPMFCLYYATFDTYLDIPSNLDKLHISLRNVNSLLTNPRFLNDYFYEALKVLYEDNVMYLEFRIPVLNAPEILTTNSIIDIVKLLKRVTNDFIKYHPDFLGAKLILTSLDDPFQINYSIDYLIKTIEELQRQFPDFFAGVDFLGDKLFDKLQNITDLYFHPLDTNWFRYDEDIIITDAISLRCKRLGRMLSILKYPELLKKVKEDNIPIELSPIYDQALGFIGNFRNHPGAYLIANNYSIAITSDFTTGLNTRGLSYDWYMVFMGIAPIDSDLQLLKQLAIDSLTYSSYENKTHALECWGKKWEQFLNAVLS